MANLSIILKDGGGTIELSLDRPSAQRVINRYAAFLKDGEQPTYRFPLEGVDGGALVIGFGNVLAMHIADVD